jgi:hypothetical protein
MLEKRAQQLVNKALNILRLLMMLFPYNEAR